MSKLIAILYVLYFVSYMLGCAYKGDVYLYSPQGAGNIIEKAVSTDAEISIPLIP
jgi:hypothetical protein